MNALFPLRLPHVLVLGVAALGLLAAPLSAQHDAPRHQWVNEPVRPLPAGVTHHRYRSAAMDGREVGYSVYLPPGYDAGQAARYPVVYWLHGGRGHEVSGVHAVAPVADRAIRAGELPPLIIVFNNGGPAWHYDDPDTGALGETALVRELIPLIDRTYRTIADRRGRAIEGMSMGGRATTRNAFKHAALFCSAAAVAAGYGNEQKAVDAGLHLDNNVFSLAREHAARGGPAIDLLIVIGTKDQNYPSNLTYMDFLRSLGIPFEAVELAGVAHSNPEYYASMGARSLRHHAASFARQR
jgi:enterochelin esterase-like enzyme